MSNQNQANLFGSLLGNFTPQSPELNTPVTGTVVMVTREGAWIDIGQKTESLIPHDQANRFGLKAGEKRDFYVLSESSEDGQVRLSLGWGSALEAHESKGTVEALVTGLAKSKDSDHIPGVNALIHDVKAFIPASKLEVRGPALKRLVNTTVSVKVITADIQSRKLVLSQKDAVEEMRKDALAKLKPEQTVSGVVTNVTDFGVFAAIGNGLSGLIHKSELTSNRSAGKDKLTELLPLGTELELVVNSIDPENGKIWFRPRVSPQAALFAKLQTGMVLSGTVARLAAFGAFVELEGSVDGLLPNRGLGVPGATAQELLKIGQKVEVVVQNVNAETQKVALMLKQPELA
jgi:small subunit ribosomal protein S1